MSQSPTILVFAGSLRKASFNKALAQAAAESAKKAGASVTYIDLADYPLPIFSQDDEASFTPENLPALRALFSEADALLIASPEYNASLTGLLKNTLDWISRPSERDDYQPKFGRQVVGIMSASPGAMGGIRGLSHLRDVLTNVGALVAPKQVAVPNAAKAFEDGKLKDPVLADRIEVMVNSVIQYSNANK